MVQVRIRIVVPISIHNQPRENSDGIHVLVACQHGDQMQPWWNAQGDIDIELFILRSDLFTEPLVDSTKGYPDAKIPNEFDGEKGSK